MLQYSASPVTSDHGDVRAPHGPKEGLSLTPTGSSARNSSILGCKGLVPIPIVVAGQVTTGLVSGPPEPADTYPGLLGTTMGKLSIITEATLSADR